MLAHPNLVRYNHVWLEVSSLSSFGPLVPCAYILQEYCNGGTLEEYMMKGRYSNGSNNDIRPHFQRDSTDPAEKIKAKKDRIRRRMSHGGGTTPPDIFNDDDEFVVQLTIHEIISFMKDITVGVKYLHQNQIIHRDLKPSNCLLSRNLISSDLSNELSEELPTVLVSDFGEGQIEGLNRMGSGSTGTLEYCAPELIQTVSGRFVSQFSKKTDIFSLGMILHYLCFSRLPYSNVWQERGDLEALTGEVRQFQGFDINISNSKLNRTDLDSELLALLDAMICVDPERRPSADQVLYTLEEVWQRYQTENYTTSTMIASSSTTFPSESSDVPPSPASTTSMPTSIVPLNSSLVPTVIYSPDFNRSTSIFANIPLYINRLFRGGGTSPPSGQTILIKGGLLAIKIASLYHLPPSNYSHLLYLLIGAELPLMSTNLSLAFFATHWLLYSIA